jgi:hypothetical protein
VGRVLRKKMDGRKRLVLYYTVLSSPPSSFLLHQVEYHDLPALLCCCTQQTERRKPRGEVDEFGWSSPVRRLITVYGSFCFPFLSFLLLLSLHAYPNLPQFSRSNFPFPFFFLFSPPHPFLNPMRFPAQLVCVCVETLGHHR